MKMMATMKTKPLRTSQKKNSSGSFKEVVTLTTILSTIVHLYQYNLYSCRRVFEKAAIALQQWI